MRILDALGRPFRKVGMQICFYNIYDVVCHERPGGRVLWHERVKNIVTTEGLNDLLTQYFKGSSYNAAWYAGLIDNTGYTALAAGDTAAKITTSANPPTTNGWQELEAYDESVRQTVTLGTASGGSIDNSASKAVFTMSATKTVYGAFLASVSSKHATTGKLYGEVAFGTAQPVIDGNTVTLTVTLTAASA